MNNKLLSVIATIASTALFAMENRLQPEVSVPTKCPSAYTRNYFLPKKNLPNKTNNIPANIHTKKTLAGLRLRFLMENQEDVNNKI